MITQEFQAQHYPILPDVIRSDSCTLARRHCHREVLRSRHHSLYTPRDFDISPYFDILKPNLLDGSNYRSLAWADDVRALQDVDRSRPAPRDRNAGNGGHDMHAEI